MPVLLFGIGVFALATGLVMVGFGIPINEFSFGNTLISAGTTAIVGGLIVIGLGAAVAQLRRIAEGLGVRPTQIGQPMEAFESTAGSRAAPTPSRVPFPPRPKSEPPGTVPAAAAEMPVDDRSFAPTLRNPEESPVAVDDEISLSPQQPVNASRSTVTGGFARPAVAPPFGSNGSGMTEKGDEPMPGRPSQPPSPPVASQTRPLHTANFDAMWPAETKPPKQAAPSEPKPKSLPDVSLRDAFAAAPKRDEPKGQKPRAVAILKSGVVDGMGYTLYVDGSIDAELPQGTLHFASISELRSHLEKNS